MKKINLAMMILAPVFVLACSSNNNPSNDLRTSTDLTVTADLNTGIPPVPTLGQQIDRMGRAAVNTALTDPFGIGETTDMGFTDSDGGIGNDAKDIYNAASDPTKWAALFTSEIAGSLGIYDGLDDSCGNQPGYTFNNGNTYTTLAGALADDELYVNTASANCTQYLAVEVSLLAKTALTDCGGRTPTENTIDVTYNILAGTPAGTVSNGITKTSNTAPDLTTFPFLGAPM